MALPGNKNFSDYDNYITDSNPTTSAQAQDYFRNQAELLKAVIDCDFWQPETVYQPGDVVKSDSMPNGTEAVMVATKASVTSNVEPSWGAVGGANVSDGACFWKLRWKHWSKEIATQSQAEAGTDNTTAMTPLQVLNAINTQRPVKTYRHFSELGLNPATATINKVLLALPDGDAFTTVIDTNTYCPNINVPESVGTLFITKALTSGYIEMRFIGSMGNWYKSVGYAWNGEYTNWEKVATNGALSMPSGDTLSVTPPSFTPNIETTQSFEGFYTAPCDGWIIVTAHGEGNRPHWFNLYNDYGVGILQNWNNWWLEKAIIPCPKGSQISLEFSDIKMLEIYFVYAQSEV